MKIYGIMSRTSVCYGHGDYREAWIWDNHPFFNSREEAETFNTAGQWPKGKVVECELKGELFGVQFFSPSEHGLMMMNPDGVWVHKQEVGKLLGNLMRENNDLKKKLEAAYVPDSRWLNPDGSPIR